jgi:uncharacterized protein (TIGR02231 family)
MDIQYKLHYAEQPKGPLPSDSPDMRRWKIELEAAQDSITELSFLKKDIQNKATALNTERNVVINNRMMKGDLQRDSFQLFTISVEYLRQRLNNIDVELLKLERESHKQRVLQGKLDNRISTLNTLISGTYNPNANVSTQPVPQVIVTVATENSIVAVIDFNYFVTAAGWSASYDLRASKESSNIELKHKATVVQNTGIDWKDALLTLSTGNPSQSNEKPLLNPFFINFDPVYAYNNQPRPAQAYAFKKQNNELSNSQVVVTTDAVAYEKGKDGSMSDYVNVNDNMTRIEYEIKLRYTIQSDNKPHNVAIQTKSMSAAYNYSVIPKLDPDVFLIARVTDWEDLNLIPGSARIYFDGSYIGESYINPRNTNDTLQLNLGRDKSIVVNRIKVKDKYKDKVLTDSRVITKVYEISIRNTKSIPIRIVVEDQMPVTQNNDIKIEYLEKSDAKFNPETGKLIWDFKLSSRDNRKLTFSYEVKFAKDKPLSNL